MTDGRFLFVGKHENQRSDIWLADFIYKWVKLQAADSLLHWCRKGLVDKQEAWELETSERGDNENYSFQLAPAAFNNNVPKKVI